MAAQARASEQPPRVPATPPRATRHHKLSQAERLELIAAYHEGLTAAELGRRFSIHPQTAQEHLRRAGIQIAKPGNTLDGAVQRQIFRLLQEGQAHAEIAAATKVSASTIARMAAADSS